VVFTDEDCRVLEVECPTPGCGEHIALGISGPSRASASGAWVAFLILNSFAWVIPSNRIDDSIGLIDSHFDLAELFG